ncbi:MAG: transaldolase [Actinomycetota bacterium]|jgi:transaldolase
MLLKQQKKVLARHMGNALADISKAGVAIWLDDLSRERLQNGSLKKLIESDYVVGVTTNPSIFASAIGKSDLYQADIVKNALLSTEEIITQLTTDDVRDACDFFAGIYESTNHQDGRVSIEVDPRFARDTNATVEQGLYLWKIIDRPNLLIKVPATIEGLPAITELIERGVSVNVTLIFSVARYKQVLQAYADGLKRRVDKQQEIGQIFSVASFFISRIDSAVDALLPTDSSLRGQTAIANAVMAYQSFLDFSNTPAWKELVNKGANVQRPLWASTGVKDPSFDPNLYVLDLVAPNTVNTMPEATLNSVRNSGVFNHDLIPSKLASSKSILAKIALAGIDLGKITDHLEVDGVSKFESAWLELMKTVNAIVGGSK